MGFVEGLKKAADVLNADGRVNGHDFPPGTYLRFVEEDGENAFRIMYPSGEKLIVTHDKVKYAAILCMGVIGTRPNKYEGVTQILGTKIRFELNDGKSGIITCSIGDNLNIVESVLF